MSKNRPQVEGLPGMPDRLAKTPPKAVEYEALTLDEAIVRSYALIDEVLATNRADHLLGLFSGGGDSSILAHLMRDRVQGFVHIDTGIAVPDTRRYVDARLRGGRGAWAPPARAGPGWCRLGAAGRCWCGRRGRRSRARGSSACSRWRR